MAVVRGRAGQPERAVKRETVVQLAGGGLSCVGSGASARVLRGALVAALVLLQTGCIEGPLSALAPASSVARSVAALWWAMAAGSGVILACMVALAWWAVRSRPEGAGARRGMRRLLIGGGLLLPGSVIAALLVFGLRMDEAQWPSVTRSEAARAFHVDIVAHRWWWEARYPATEAGAARRSVNVLYVPAGVPVHLDIRASDVIHAFWVPRIAGKLDAVPGRVNRLRLLVDEPGEYAGICAEYCGEGHAQMRFTLIVLEPDALQKRLAEAAEEVE